jgi:hypothetical protein
MPKITINELDLTTGGLNLATDNVVYIPGFSSLTLASSLIGVPTLFTTLEDFEAKMGEAPKSFVLDSTKDKSFIMAYELLKAGLFVLYEVPAATLGGTTAVATVAEMETALAQAGFWNRLKDRGLYDIRFLTSGAYLKGDTAVANIMLQVVGGATGRGDAVVLLDHASNLTAKSAVQTHFDTIGAFADAKFGAGFTPWINVTSELIPGAESNLMPGSFGYLLAFSESVRVNYSWLAVAGATRGKIPSLVTPFVSIRYGEVEANDFQSRTAGAITINPICNVTPYGFILWGNRTLSPVGAGTTVQTDLVASNFLNIRNLVSSIKKVLFTTSRGLTFEQNSDILWINFKSGIIPLLDQMIAGNGIADYRILKKTAEKKATLKAVIKIVPIEAVEDFDLTIEMSDSLDTVTE